MRSFRQEPGLLNGRLLRQPPVTRYSGKEAEGKFWGVRDPSPSGAHPGGLEMAGGFYDNDELAHYVPMAKKGIRHVQDQMGYDDEEAADHVRRFSQPLQGAFFDPRSFQSDDEERKRAIASHSTELKRSGYFDPQDLERERKAGEQIKSSMFMSRMPDELIKATSGHTIADPDLHTSGGFYSPGTVEGDITVRTSDNRGISSSTVRHELGHRADYRSMDAETMYGQQFGPYVGSSFPNPRAEGVADAFRDRYDPQGPGEDFRHFDNTGYSTHNQAWRHTTDPAIYAASRAHFQETGENPTESSPDAYLHKMMMTSPHAVKALRQNGLKVRGAAAVDRYRGMRQVGTQLSLIEGMEQPVYDIPESHKKPS